MCKWEIQYHDEHFRQENRLELLALQPYHTTPVLYLSHSAKGDYLKLSRCAEFDNTES
jgi:hypothetical protein